MTRKEFENIAESWYQRTHWLRRYSENVENDIFKRIKAKLLFFIMLSKMSKCTQIYIKLNQVKYKPNTDFKSGGFNY